MKLENLKQKALDNKGWAVAGFLLILMVLGGLGTVYTQFQNVSSGGAYQQDLARSSGFIPPGGSGGSGSYVEVQEGSISVESDDVEQDTEYIRRLADNFNGYVESSSRNDNDLYTNADMTVKVPEENFQSFVNSMKQDYKVESYSVSNYRLYTERERDELEILNQTMMEYESIRQDVNAMDNDAEKLDLLMRITDKQLEVREKQREYENRLADKQQRGDYATVNINLRERRQIDLMPDDLGQRFRNEVNEMVDNVASTLITTLTGGVEIFFTAIKYIIYLAIIGAPAVIGYKIARRIYEKLF